MALINDVKAAIRISASTTAFDVEVGDLISAAQSDLVLSGVIAAKAQDDTDPLIKRAVTVYVKANFGWDNPDADRLQQSYNMLKTHLALSKEYTGYVITFTVSAGATPLENATVTFNGEAKITNTSGQAVFSGVKSEQNMAYTVVLEGYQDALSMVDISGSATVSVSMTAVV